jgi:hypothetical protein
LFPIITRSNINCVSHTEHGKRELDAINFHIAVWTWVD